MPQMFPMNWLILFFTFNLSLFIFSCFIFPHSSMKKVIIPSTLTPNLKWSW